MEGEKKEKGKRKEENIFEVSYNYQSSEKKKREKKEGKKTEDSEKKEGKETEDSEKEEGKNIEEEKTEMEIIRETKREVFSFLKKRANVIVYLLLAIILWINIRIRSLPMPKLRDVTTGEYTLGPDLDPFLFLRYAKYIVEHGSLMKIDMMRYVPAGFETAKETPSFPYMIAYLHKFITLFRDVSVEYSAVIFPVVFSVFTTIFFFLLVRKIFEEKGKAANIIALIGSALLVVLPSLLPRTIAGIPEKESAGFCFIFAAFYLFLCAWKSKNLKKGLIFGGLAGLFTAIMISVWGGWIFIFAILSIFFFLAFLFGKIKKKEFLIYSIWIFIVFLMIIFIFSDKLIYLVTNNYTYLAIGVFIILVIDFLIFQTRIKDIGIIRGTREKIPDRIFSLLISTVVIIISSTLIFGISFIPNFISYIISQLTVPYKTRLMFTVAENQQPFFSDWKGLLGPIVKGIPLFFWLFFIGSIFLFYEMIRAIKKKDRLILTLVYIIFLLALIFSKSSAQSVFNGTNAISKAVYFGGVLLIIGSFIYLYYRYYKNEELELLQKINFSYLFLFILFFVSIIAARSAVRFIMVLAPMGAIIVSHFVVSTTTKALKTKEELMKILIWMAVIIIILATAFTFYGYYYVCKLTAQDYAPSMYSVQWQKAMAWVRDNTPKEAVFGHWWDYGYWVQTQGERATMLDGGNAISYWNYLMGRYVLTSPNETDALELLYSHNITYYLIDPTEIGKYSTYSSIGSDENYDRYSWIEVFLLNEQATQETRNETIYSYRGIVGLDEDYLYKNEKEETFLSAEITYITGISVKMEEYEDSIISKQPEAVFSYKDRKINIPLKYLHYEGKLYEFKTGYGGCLYIIPEIKGEEQGVKINDKGAALFLSERNMRALWVRLYLLGEGENFELVHSELSPRVESLRDQGLNIGDFLFYQGVQGPIKIWKIKYTGNEKINPEYLQLDYPERIKERKFA